MLICFSHGPPESLPTTKTFSYVDRSGVTSPAVLKISRNNLRKVKIYNVLCDDISTAELDRLLAHMRDRLFAPKPGQDTASAEGSSAEVAVTDRTLR